MQWCNRRILARIHQLTLGRLRREIEPVTALDLYRFLCRWQHLAPGTQLHGAEGTLQVIRQLQGYEIPAASWEPEILARRVANYEPAYLDELCLSGEVMWGRLSPHPAHGRRRRTARSAHPHRADFIFPARESGLAAAASPPCQRIPDEGGLSPAAQDVLGALRARGASFFADLSRGSGRLASEVEDALWELVAAGLVTADGFENLRALIDPRRRRGQGRERGQASAPFRRPLGIDAAERTSRGRRCARRGVRRSADSALGRSDSRSAGQRNNGAVLARSAAGTCV